MNSPLQIATVKAIIDIKNEILNSADWDEMAYLVQKAIDTCYMVPGNSTPDHSSLNKTVSKEWNIKSVRRAMQCINERSYPDIKTAHFEVAASLLMLSIAFVANGVDDVIKIAA